MVAAFPTELWVADIINAAFFLVGALLLMRFMKGTAIRKWTKLSVVGILLYSILHEGGEVLAGSGIHGGIPQTPFGSFHIIAFGVLGSTLFLISAFMINREYRRLLKEAPSKARKVRKHGHN